MIIRLTLFDDIIVNKVIYTQVRQNKRMFLKLLMLQVRKFNRCERRLVVKLKTCSFSCQHGVEYVTMSVLSTAVLLKR